MDDQTSVVISSVLVGMVFIGIAAGLMFGIPAYSRYQSVLDARNQVVVSSVLIQNTKQLVEVEQQKAQVRIAEARGIAQAQHIIDSSLTTNYLQYMAIQAQEKMAESPNHTEVYVPSGANGIPLIKTLP